VKEYLALLKMVIFPDDFRLETLSGDTVNVEGVINPGEYVAGELICRV
jgi:hypothetical protein